MTREQQAFRRAMRRGLPTEHGRLWYYAEEIIGVGALLTWVGACLYLLGMAG